DHVAVVDDLMPHIDRRAVAFDRALDDLDRPVDAGTKPARRGDQNRQRRLGGAMACVEKGGVHGGRSSRCAAVAKGLGPPLLHKGTAMTFRTAAFVLAGAAAALAGCAKNG